MENNRDDLVVILAGYKDKMDIFFQSNPGMGSRIAHHVHFPDYSLDELMGIACLILEEQKYSFSEEAEAAFREYLERRMKQPRFANGRSVRNALERARLRQATRIVQENSHSLSRDDLMRIEAEDILASRVFEDGEEDDGNGNADADAGDEPDKKDVE
jgi:hypothetical protein